MADKDSTYGNELTTFAVWMLILIVLLAALWVLAGARIFLAILTIIAVVGVFPVTYLAYRRNRRGVQIERLEKEFDLLGLVDKDEKYKVEDLYDQVYNPTQFILYISVIVILSIAVLLAFGAQLEPDLASLLSTSPAVPVVVTAMPGPAATVPVTQTAAGLPPASGVITGQSDSLSTTVGIVTAPPVSPTVVTATVGTSTTGAGGTATPAPRGEPAPQGSNTITLMFIGYLGAYVYSIQELIRRYNTFDLQPQVYAGILVRMLLALVLVFVGAAALVAFSGAAAPAGTPTLAAGYTAIWAPAIVAFMIGVFPSRGIQWFGRLADRVMSSPAEMANDLPIENLLGMSTWHASRLRQIGIDDAQNLAHADISKLLLTTQFDPQVIVNWIDQSILYEKVGSRISNFRGAQITTFSEFDAALENMNQIADAAVRGRALDTLAASLLGAGIDAQQFQRLADASNYPNYNHIVEYYQRMPTVVQQWAAEGMRQLVANILQQFESAEDIERWIKRTKRTMLLSRNLAPAEMIKLLGNAYFELAQRYTDQDVRRAALLDAQSNYQSAAGRDRSDAQVYFLLSSCLNELARLDATAGNPTEAATGFGEAVAAATQAIALRGDLAEAHVNRAVAYHGQGKTDLALNDLNDALYLDDRLARAYVQRAVLFTIKGNQAAGSEDSAQDYYSRAVADYERAYWTGYSDVAAVWLGIGEASLKRRDYDRAETELSRAIESLNERQLAQAYLLRGTVCRNRGPEGYDAAENDFTQAILRASQAGDTATQVEATFKRGDLRVSMVPPRYPAAIEDFTGVLVLNPGHTAARARRGVAYERLGQLTEARQDLEAVLAADPQGKSQEARLSRAALGMLQGTNP